MAAINESFIETFKAKCDWYLARIEKIANESTSVKSISDLKIDVYVDLYCDYIFINDISYRQGLKDLRKSMLRLKAKCDAIVNKKASLCFEKFNSYVEAATDHLDFLKFVIDQAGGFEYLKHISRKGQSTYCPTCFHSIDAVKKIKSIIKSLPMNERKDFIFYLGRDASSQDIDNMSKDMRECIYGDREYKKEMSTAIKLYDTGDLRNFIEENLHVKGDVNVNH